MWRLSSQDCADLTAALRDYDGRDTKYLQALADQNAASPDYVDCLISCFDLEPTSITDGATWLFLAWLRGGGGGDGGGGDGGDGGDGENEFASPQQVDAMLAKLPALTSWGAQLHICQSARLFPIDADQALVLAEWLRPLLAAKKPFVRAWSLDAFMHVCALLPSHAGEGRMALEAGLNDPAASVRARARNLS